MEDYYKAYKLLVEVVLGSDKKVQRLLHIQDHTYTIHVMVSQWKFTQCLKHLVYCTVLLYCSDMTTDVFIAVRRLSTSCNLVSYMLSTTIASFTAGEHSLSMEERGT